MNHSTVANRLNLELIEEYHRRWLEAPDSVEPSWRFFFEGFDLGREGGGEGAAPSEGNLRAAQSQASVTRLIDAYREMGHYLADLDPLKLTPRNTTHELLEPAFFGLTEPSGGSDPARG